MDAEERRRRAQLVESNLGLVLETARSLRGKGVPFSDLVQEGSVALLGAAEEMDPLDEAEFRRRAEFVISKRLRDVVEGDGVVAKSSGLLTNAHAPDPHVLGLEAEKIEKTHALLAMLTEDQERVLRMRFGIDSGGPVTLEAAARSLRINRWRVSGLESRALSALRRAVHRLRWTFPR